MQAAATATAKFQLAVPYVLSPLSPALAALHACRARVQHPSDDTLRTTHCPACGYSYLDGRGHIRSMRLRKKRHAEGTAGFMSVRVLRRSCGVCGHVDDLRTATGEEALAALPSPRKRRKTAAPAQQAIRDAPSLVKSPTAPKHDSRAASVQSDPPAPRSRSLASPLPPASPAPSPSPALNQSKASATPGMPTGPSGASTPPTSARAKARPKKTSTLQTMLARNREKQNEGKKQGQLGLSTFLQELG